MGRQQDDNPYDLGKGNTTSVLKLRDFNSGQFQKRASPTRSDHATKSNHYGGHGSNLDKHDLKSHGNSPMDRKWESFAWHFDLAHEPESLRKKNTAPYSGS